MFLDTYNANYLLIQQRFTKINLFLFLVELHFGHFNVFDEFREWTIDGEKFDSETNII